MGKVTKVSPQKRKGRFNVYIDGKYAFPVSSETLLKFDISKGKELNRKKINDVIEEDVYQTLFNKILNFLSYRLRSEKEVMDRSERYLKGAETSTEIDNERLKERVRDKLLDLKLLDDKAFAYAFIEQKMQSTNPVGPRYLKNALFKRGISETIFEECLLELGEDVETEKAMQVVDKKMKALKEKDKRKAKAKLVKYLYGRGFSPGVVYDVVDTKLKVP